MGHPLLDLDGKTAVVIGGTSGICFTITRALAQAGANVVPTGRRSELWRDPGHCRPRTRSNYTTTRPRRAPARPPAPLTTGAV